LDLNIQNKQRLNIKRRNRRKTKNWTE